MTTKARKISHTVPNRNSLYPDFTLSKDNCASEPIHRPVAIQCHGHLLVFDTSRDKPVLYALSAQLAPCLGQSSETIFTECYEQWLPEPIVKLVNETGSSEYGPLGLAQTVSLSGIAFQVTHHLQNCKLIIELEPEADTSVGDHVIRTSAQAFRHIDNLQELYTEATRRVAEAFEYDRVMIYKFDEDQHGCVVGEQKADHLEPFLGLHYPESDIPKMARDLFLLIKSRAICDVDIDYEKLLFDPVLAANQPYLDLSYSQLRATSPIHIQYLQNMGVAASLTFALIVQGKLWGLIACHHCSKRQVLFNHKLIGEAIADLLVLLC